MNFSSIFISKNNLLNFSHRIAPRSADHVFKTFWLYIKPYLAAGTPFGLQFNFRTSALKSLTSVQYTSALT